MATGTFKHYPISSGTPTIVTGSHASVASGWGYVSWAKWGQVVIVTFYGLQFSQTIGSTPVDTLKLPYKAKGSQSQPGSYSIGFLAYIGDGLDVVRFSNVGTANKTLFGQLIYITDD